MRKIKTEIKVVKEEEINEYLKDGWLHVGTTKKYEEIVFIIERTIYEKEDKKRNLSMFKEIIAWGFFFAGVLGIGKGILILLNKF